MSWKVMKKIGKAVALGAQNISPRQSQNIFETMTTAVDDCIENYEIVELLQKIKLMELKCHYLQQRHKLVEEALLNPKYIKELEEFIEEVEMSRREEKDFLRWSLQQNKYLQLELLNLRHCLQQELVLKEVKKSLELVEKQKNMQKSPIWLIAYNLLKSHDNKQENSLQIFLAFPSLNLERFASNSKVAGGFSNLETSISEAIRKLTNEYSNDGRQINFFSGTWITNYLRKEANVQTLFSILKTEPTLVLETEIDGDFLNFRISFWGGESEHYHSEIVISRLCYKNILTNSAKIRAIQWLKTRKKLILAGENAAKVDQVYGGENQENLMTLKREVKLKKAGINVKELELKYLVNKQDVELLREMINIWHCLVIGLVADEYFLKSGNKTPILSKLLPKLVTKVQEGEVVDYLEKSVGLFYNDLYQSLAESRWYLLPELILDLADKFTQWQNKYWAKKTIVNSLRFWLKQHKLPQPNKWKELLDEVEAAVGREDEEYVRILNQCLAGVGEKRELKIKKVERENNFESLVKSNLEIREEQINIEEEIFNLEETEKINIDWIYQAETLLYPIESDERTIIMVQDPEKTKPSDFAKLKLKANEQETEENFKILRTLTAHSGTVRCLAISPDGKLLVSGSYDKTIKIWELEAGQEIRTLKKHSGDIEALAISPNGEILASASDDGTIKIWELKTGRQIDNIKGNYKALAINPDSNILATSDTCGYVNWWEMSKVYEVQTLKGHTGIVHSLKFNEKINILASGSADKTIKIWDINTGKEQITLTGHSRKVNTLVFSPDNKIIYSGSDDRMIKAWEVSTGKEICNFVGHAGWVYCLSINPDGKILFSGSADKTIKMWQVSTGEKIRTLKGHSNLVYSLAISPDGQTLVSGSADNTIKIWRKRLFSAHH